MKKPLVQTPGRASPSLGSMRQIQVHTMLPSSAIISGKPDPVSVPIMSHRQPIALIILTGMACYGLVVATDYVIWDGWWYSHFIRNRSETPFLHRILREIGRPQDIVFFLPFFLTDNIAWWSKILGVMAWVGAAICQYGFLMKALSLPGSTALVIVILSLCCPFFTFVGELTFNLYTISVFLFWLAWSLVGDRIAGRRDGPMVRILTASIFAASFELNSHIAHLYAVGLFLIAYRLPKVSLPMFAAMLPPILARYWELLSLPVVYWIWKNTMTPTSGYYTSYNVVALDPLAIASGYGIFLRDLPFHITELVGQASGPAFAAGLLAIIVCKFWRDDLNSFFHKSVNIRLGFLLCSSTFLFLCSIFSYCAVGQVVMCDGWAARNTILVNLPFATMLFCVFGLLQRRFVSETPRALLIPVLVTVCVGVVACNYTTLRWQAFGVKQQAIQSGLRQILAPEYKAQLRADLNETDRRPVNVVNLRDYYHVRSTLDYYPSIVWTYLVAPADAVPRVFILETTRQIQDKVATMPDGSNGVEIAKLQVGPAQLRDLMEDTTLPYALMQVPLSGRTITVAVMPGDQGVDGVSIGFTYLLKRFFNSSSLDDFRNSIVKVVNLE